MISKLHLVNGALYTLAGSILGATLLTLLLFLRPVNVLIDWRLLAPKGDAHTGQTIVIQSLFTKVKAVDGISSRKLLCDNAQGEDISYPLSVAVADHAVQKRTGVSIPITIPAMSTPATCRVMVSIKYQIYPFRSMTQSTTSNSFYVVK